MVLQSYPDRKCYTVRYLPQLSPNRIHQNIIYILVGRKINAAMTQVSIEVGGS